MIPKTEIDSLINVPQRMVRLFLAMYLVYPAIFLVNISFIIGFSKILVLGKIVALLCIPIIPPFTIAFLLINRRLKNNLWSLKDEKDPEILTQIQSNINQYPLKASLMIFIGFLLGTFLAILIAFLKGATFSWQQAVFLLILGEVPAAVVGYIFFYNAKIALYPTSHFIDFNPLTIFFKLSVPLVSTILLLLNISYLFTYKLFTNNLISSQQQALAQVARKAQIASASFFDRYLTQIQLLAQDASLRKGLNTETGQLLQNWHQRQETNINDTTNKQGLLILSDLEGNAISSDARKFSVSEKSFFKVYSKNTEDVYPDHHFCNSLKNNAMVLSVPVLDDRKMINGILSYSIEIDLLEQLFEGLYLPEDYSYIIINSSGEIIASNESKLASLSLSKIVSNPAPLFASLAELSKKAIPIDKANKANNSNEANKYQSNDHDNATTVITENSKTKRPQQVSPFNEEGTLQMTMHDISFTDLTIDKNHYVAAITTFHAENGQIIIMRPRDHFYRAINDVLLDLSITLIVITIVVNMVILYISRQISNPIKQMRHIFIGLSEGNLSIVTGSYIPDEFGDLHQNLEYTVRKLNVTIMAMIKASHRLTEDALTLSHESQDLSQNSAKQASSSDQASAALEETLRSVELVAENAKAQQKATKQNHLSMEKLKKRILEVDAFASQALDIANFSASEAKNGSASMQNTIVGINHIADSTREISQFIGKISDISDQVNLLALNAAIEAARAGDHGLGFAVVADQIGKLAVQTSDSAKQINKLVSTGLGEVEKGLDFVNQTSQSLNAIVENIKKTDSMIEKISQIARVQSNESDIVLQNTHKVMDIAESISLATNEQVTAQRDVIDSINTINEATQSVSTSSANVASSANHVHGQSESLNKHISFFQLR